MNCKIDPDLELKGRRTVAILYCVKKLSEDLGKLKPQIVKVSLLFQSTQLSFLVIRKLTLPFLISFFSYRTVCIHFSALSD